MVLLSGVLQGTVPKTCIMKLVSKWGKKCLGKAVGCSWIKAPTMASVPSNKELVTFLKLKLELKKLTGIIAFPYHFSNGTQCVEQS